MFLQYITSFREIIRSPLPVCIQHMKRGFSNMQKLQPQIDDWSSDFASYEFIDVQFASQLRDSGFHFFKIMNQLFGIFFCFLANVLCLAVVFCKQCLDDIFAIMVKFFMLGAKTIP